jgi:hypothetical protein
MIFNILKNKKAPYLGAFLKQFMLYRVNPDGTLYASLWYK